MTHYPDAPEFWRIARFEKQLKALEDTILSDQALAKIGIRRAAQLGIDHTDVADIWPVSVRPWLRAKGKT